MARIIAQSCYGIQIGIRIASKPFACRHFGKIVRVTFKDRIRISDCSSVCTLLAKGDFMDIHYSEIENQIRVIKLAGALDIVGVTEIDVRFSGYCSGEHVRVVVDLADVEFLASIGIRLLTSNAKSLTSRGGKLVLLSPVEEVRNVLEITGILSIIPTFDRVEDAQAALVG